jgi:carbon monoxide dehydrogenase subunit G
MYDMSYFESRPGKLTCTAEEVFNFVANIRNFERFIPQGTINNWQSDGESCSFSVSMLGTVNIRLSEKEMFKKVVFAGDALKKNDFTLVLNISDNVNKPAEVKVTLKADLNPMLKMIASKPIGQFLEKLINEMESFRDWKDTRV